MNTHSLQLATEPFSAITSGSKVIESRLFARNEKELSWGVLLNSQIEKRPTKQFQ